MTQNTPKRLILFLITLWIAPAAFAASHEGLRFYSLGVRAPMSSPLTMERGMALKLTVLPPTVGGGVPGGEVAATFSPQAARSDAVTLHLNAAAGVTGEQRITSFAGAIFEGPRSWLARPVYEMFIERDLNGATELSVLVGALYKLAENLTLDAGFRFSRGDELGLLVATASSEVRCGLTWLF